MAEMNTETQGTTQQSKLIGGACVVIALFVVHRGKRLAGESGLPIIGSILENTVGSVLSNFGVAPIPPYDPYYYGDSYGYGGGPDFPSPEDDKDNKKSKKGSKKSKKGSKKGSKKSKKKSKKSKKGSKKSKKGSKKSKKKSKKGKKKSTKDSKKGTKSSKKSTKKSKKEKK